MRETYTLKCEFYTLNCKLYIVMFKLKKVLPWHLYVSVNVHTYFLNELCVNCLFNYLESDLLEVCCLLSEIPKMFDIYY